MNATIYIQHLEQVSQDLYGFDMSVGLKIPQLHFIPMLLHSSRRKKDVCWDDPSIQDSYDSYGRNPSNQLMWIHTLLFLVGFNMV